MIHRGATSSSAGAIAAFEVRASIDRWQVFEGKPRLWAAVLMVSGLGTDVCNHRVASFATRRQPKRID